MTLSSMRFKDFVWPHNPRVYSITYERKMAVHKVPFGRHFLQSLGQTRRVFRGEGEFVGPGAYETFSRLASVFYEETAGTLVHPVWVTTTAWFVGLKLEQQPRPDYVRYSFEFWEALSGETQLRSLGGGQSAGTGSAVAEAEQVWHTVVRGDTLWALARRYGTTVEGIVGLNPSIRNPNLIYVGQRVRIT